MSREFFGIMWAKPSYLVWFPLAVVGLALLFYRLKKTQSIYTILAGNRLLERFKNVSKKKQILKAMLMGTGLVFLFLALLHPQWNKKEEIVEQEARELFVALDISRSMLATDCVPNRLQCAREKIKKLLTLLSCDRVGLILFSGSAFVQCPLTDDYSAFFMFLDQVDVELISSGTTALDQAIKQTLGAFQRMPDRKSKLLILFTDGEDFSHNLSGIKKEAQEEGLHIFTFGVGTTQGAPVPLFDEHGAAAGHQKDYQGNVVISRLNENILRTLAQDAGGKYLSVTKNDDDLRALVRYVHMHEKERIEDKTFERMEQQYPYFLGVSFFCFALEWLL